MRSSNWNLFKMLLRECYRACFIGTMLRPSKTIVLFELKSTLRNNSHLSASSCRSEDVKNSQRAGGPITKVTEERARHGERVSLKVTHTLWGLCSTL